MTSCRLKMKIRIMTNGRNIIAAIAQILKKKPSMYTSTTEQFRRRLIPHSCFILFPLVTIHIPHFLLVILKMILQQSHIQ